MMNPNPDNPITELCIVSDKNRCPPNFSPITRAHDDASYDTDLWKDSLFSFSRIYRYICVCKTVPQNAYTCSVVADIALVNDKDNIPTGFTPIEYTADSKEKALRKKLLCVRTVPREFAVDAVCDFIILARQKRTPAGYSLAGELEGLLLCYKYGVIPPSFPSQSPTESGSGVYPNLPYPIHPLSHASSDNRPNRIAPSPPFKQQPFQTDTGSNNVHDAGHIAPAYNRQSSLASSVHNTGIEGIPFELNPRIKSSKNNKLKLPFLKPISIEDYEYNFSVESTVLVDGFS